MNLVSHPAPRGAEGGAAVHLAGRMTDHVFGFLGPATAALAASGVEQVVVLIDAPEYRHLLPLFDPAVKLLLSPDERSALRRWQRLAQAFRGATRRADLRAVHLHGFLPLMVCACAMTGSARRDVPVYYSPHGSKALSALRLLTRPAVWATRAAFLPTAEHPIASVSAEASSLKAMVGHPVALVETPVDPAFFALERGEDEAPLVVGSGRIGTPRSAELVVQMAVLMGGDELRLRFDWIGPVDAVSAMRLKAAGVEVHAVTRIDERAQRLSAAWIYVAPGLSLGFPLHLAEAMAAGLPCVAIDSPMHRSLLRHGDTGLLCSDGEDMLRQVARLVDDRALRIAMGRNARREAEQRFAQARFRDELLAAYEMERRLPA